MSAIETRLLSVSDVFIQLIRVVTETAAIESNRNCFNILTKQKPVYIVMIVFSPTIALQHHRWRERELCLFISSAKCPTTKYAEEHTTLRGRVSNKRLGTGLTDSLLLSLSIDIDSP